MTDVPIPVLSCILSVKGVNTTIKLVMTQGWKLNFTVTRDVTPWVLRESFVPAF